MSVKEKVRNLKEYIKKGGAVYAFTVRPMAFESREMFKGKTVVITGGTSGIGLDIAEALSEHETNIIICGRNIEKLKEAESRIKCDSIQMDIRDTAALGGVMQRLFEKYGDIDSLINCAGIYKWTEFDTVTEEDYDAIMDTNLKGMYFFTQQYVRNICDIHKEHKVINVLSNNSFKSSSNPYNLSKWGGLCFTQGLAKDLLSKNVIVNAVAPGPTCSAINPHDPDGNLYNPGRKYAPYFLRPEQITNVVKFLLSDFSRGIVGQTIVVDGGETL